MIMDSDCPCSGASLDKLLQPAILSALTEGPIHGYRLSERINEMVGMYGDKPDVSGIYRFLKKMETTGHVVSSWEAGSKGHAKRLYEITAEGRACLARWTSTLETYMDAVGRLLTEAKAAVARQPNRRKIGEKQTVTNAGMDASHGIGRDGLDSLDLKVLLLTEGIFVHEEVFKVFGPTHHISPDPLECSVLFLPDGTVVHIANIGPAAPFHLALGSKGNLCLLREGDFVTEVSLPKTTGFYRQRTSRGVPFRGLAVLQGHDVLAFPYLWPCEFAKAGQACKFCHCGNYTQHQTTVGVPENVVFAPQDVAEAVDYAVNVEHCARHIQLTGGSTLDAGGECGRIFEILESIDDVAGIANIPGEIIVYTTPPAMAKEIDSLFAAGADRIACDIEIWNEELFRQICPGKSQWTGRQRALDALLHIAERAWSQQGVQHVRRGVGTGGGLSGRGRIPCPQRHCPDSLDLDAARPAARAVARQG